MKLRIVKQNIGVDISKSDFRVCLLVLNQEGKMTIKGTRKFNNNVPGFKGFTSWAQKKSNPDICIRIVVEATGVYHEDFIYFLHEKTDFHLSVELPNKVKAFAKSLNVKSKTDPVDVKVLGRLGLERNLEQWHPISQDLRTLRQLTRYKSQLQELKTATSNRLHAQLASYKPNKKVVKGLRKLVRQLEKQIADTDDNIKDTIALDPVLQERVDKICLIKGVKVATVAVIIAETGGFELFRSRSQLISFAGYDIVQRESGTSVKGKTRISKKGNRYIRKALFFPAMTAARFEPVFHNLYQRVLDRTKIGKKANVAVQRKLLVLIYTLFKKNEAYDRDFERRKINANKESVQKVVDRDKALSTLDDRSKATSL